MAVALRPIAAEAPVGTPLSRMAADVRVGLLTKPPYLPSKYLYDDTGSALFELMSSLPDYYQTRVEEKLLAEVIDDVIARSTPSELLELGSGAGNRIRSVLDAQQRAGAPLELTLFDTNRGFVGGSARRLAGAYPELQVTGIAGDFTRDLHVLGRKTGRLALMFAGTIGTMHPDEMIWFLDRLAAQLGPGDCFLAGVDLEKHPRALEAAYHDGLGVAAAFNLNILEHVNRELNADFDLSRFQHVAFWDPQRKWVELRIRATAPCRVRIEDSWLDLRFAAGDEIRTEINCKYTHESFKARVSSSAFDLEQWYTDRQGQFALALLRRMR